MPRPLVTLTTDFGNGSLYVAQMKGVLLGICPDAEIVDITHGIAPQNIRQTAIILADTTRWFPENTLHVAVVDPGVGTSRRLVYAEIGKQRYLAPDNGLLSRLTHAYPAARTFALENGNYFLSNVSSTFHGRDILSPVAAHLLRGVDPTSLGPPVASLIHFDWPRPHALPDRLEGEVLYVDSFGNLISNITADDLTTRATNANGLPERIVECAGRRIVGIQATYGLSKSGDIVAILDSQGRLEIAAVNENAAQRLDAGEGTPIVVF